MAQPKKITFWSKISKHNKERENRYDSFSKGVFLTIVTTYHNLKENTALRQKVLHFAQDIMLFMCVLDNYEMFHFLNKMVTDIEKVFLDTLLGRNSVLK